MISGDIQSQLQLIAKAVATPLIDVSDTPLELPRLMPGDRISATVLASLPNGRFQVLISDQVLDLNLPKNTQPGEELDLTFISAKPRLTFALTSEAAASQSAGAALAGRASVSLSETAKLLGALLQGAASRDEAQAAAQAKAAAPLLAGAPANTRELAQALRSALSQSGLFYESHQAEWVTGKRPLLDLLLEPQGRLSSLAQTSSRAAPALPQPLAQPQPQPQVQAGKDVQPQAHTQVAPNETPKAAAAASLEAGRAVQTAQPQQPDQRPGAADGSQAQRGTVSQGTDATAAAKPAPGAGPVHSQALPLVQQQLGVLDSRQLAWQGQVWPGQVMDWRVEEGPERQNASPQEMPEWRTRLHLRLPRLGEVSAVLGLSGQGIRVDFRAVDPGTARTIRDNHPALYDALQAAGLKVLGLTVERDGQA